MSSLTVRKKSWFKDIIRLQPHVNSKISFVAKKNVERQKQGRISASVYHYPAMPIFRHVLWGLGPRDTPELASHAKVIAPLTRKLHGVRVSRGNQDLL